MINENNLKFNLQNSFFEKQLFYSSNDYCFIIYINMYLKTTNYKIISLCVELKNKKTRLVKIIDYLNYKDIPTFEILTVKELINIFNERIIIPAKMTNEFVEDYLDLNDFLKDYNYVG